MFLETIVQTVSTDRWFWRLARSKQCGTSTVYVRTHRKRMRQTILHKTAFKYVLANIKQTQYIHIYIYIYMPYIFYLFCLPVAKWCSRTFVADHVFPTSCSELVGPNVGCKEFAANVLSSHDSNFHWCPFAILKSESETPTCVLYYIIIYYTMLILYETRLHYIQIYYIVL